MFRITVLLVVFSLITGCTSVVTNTDTIDRKSRITVFYDEGEKKEIELAHIDKPVVRASATLGGSFEKFDGVYWYPESMSLEGLSGFSVSEGDSWLLRFSAEPLQDDRYSVFSYALSHAGEVKRRGEVTFLGSIDTFSKTERPLVTIVGVMTKNEDWFSVGVAIGDR